MNKTTYRPKTKPDCCWNRGGNGSVCAGTGKGSATFSQLNYSAWLAALFLSCGRQVGSVACHTNDCTLWSRLTLTVSLHTQANGAALGSVSVTDGPRFAQSV